MITDTFGALLQELGKMLKIPHLQPDQNNSCLIKFNNGLSIQLELDKGGYFLLIGCDLGPVPPGRYRENVFREALMANGMPYPRYGDFSYSRKSDHLLLTSRLPIKDLNGEKIALELTPFIEKANNWQNSLSRGEIPSHIPSTLSSKGGSGMFGLK